MNNNKQLIRIQGFVNRQYFNENNIKIEMSMKHADGSIEKINATIWRTNANGEDTFAYEEYKQFKDYMKLSFLDFDAEEGNQYNGVRQVAVKYFLRHRTYTDEQYNAREARFKDYLTSKGDIYHTPEGDKYREYEDEMEKEIVEYNKPQSVETTPTPAVMETYRNDIEKQIASQAATVARVAPSEVPIDDLPWEIEL